MMKMEQELKVKKKKKKNGKYPFLVCIAVRDDPPTCFVSADSSVCFRVARSKLAVDSM